MKLTKKKIVIGLIVLFVVFAIGSSGSKSATNKAETTQTGPTQAPMKVTAQEIADDFDGNQVAAEKKWNGKLVQFSASISNITDTGLSFTNVASKEVSFTQISCRVTDKDSLLSLKNGQTVTVRGTVGKQMVGVIDVSDCELVQ